MLHSFAGVLAKGFSTFKSASSCKSVLGCFGVQALRPNIRQKSLNMFESFKSSSQVAQTFCKVPGLSWQSPCEILILWFLARRYWKLQQKVFQTPRWGSCLSSLFFSLLVSFHFLSDLWSPFLCLPPCCPLRPLRLLFLSLFHLLLSSSIPLTETLALKSRKVDRTLTRQSLFLQCLTTSCFPLNSSACTTCVTARLLQLCFQLREHLVHLGALVFIQWSFHTESFNTAQLRKNLATNS